jgi:hydroxymethylpyrimidine/phosphomethylpyrimidine kinase
MLTDPPVVITFGGWDPTSGAGVAADILTLASLGCYPAGVVTAVTAQDTTGVKQYSPLAPEIIIAQARALLEDMSVAAFKTGMLCNSAIVSAVASIVDDYPDVPLVVDPVQMSGLRQPLADEPLEEALRVLLLPRALLVTPNSIEARELAPGADTLDACAQEIMSLGCEYVLITGTHEATPQVLHRLYANKRLIDTFSFERLPHNYHGSGCTLASACAGTLAHRLDPANAVTQALHYTWNTLKHGYRLGMGQYLPDRLYWGRSAERPGGA